MDSGNSSRTMDQRIFSLDLPVEAVSLYLLCCGLVDGGATVSAKNIIGMWNGTPDELTNAHKILEAKNIVIKILSDGEGHDMYRVMDADEWE
ncbi:hypothetical protein [Desulfatibacillum aliphaticivorans]|uniref:Uncharacterized protein n=1 Tax=Desulfatibacillum aliphaticivorans TaxID=218208 RepID=B8FDT5_DESAL|nr:hypothetical protein [Desulfatibacillum aliphaticivorans]ACL06716.1 hypothetical protein Dalk_5045 [Desulfatibacillum aliphaticivorans]